LNSPIETRSGLAPWARAELPPPPSPRGLGWLAAVGPGVIVLGLSIGSGEFLLGPAVFVRHGLTLLWVTVVAIVLQTLFNLEVMRYTVATGEPVFTGFMRTRPSASLWACVYGALYLLQYGWPAFAGTAAGGLFFLAAGRLPRPSDAGMIYGIGVGIFLACVGILCIGRRIVRTLEVLNWGLVATTLGALLVLALVFVPASRWGAGLAALSGFSTDSGRFEWFPPGADLVLLAALVAYSGAGGAANLVLSNWARDKGYGMSAHVGYIPAAMGSRVDLAACGFMFPPDPEAMRRWRGWWRIVRADQWGVFASGALLGMLLPALLYVTFLPAGEDIQGLGISAALASAVGERSGPLLATGIALLGAWLLFKTQLDNFEGMVRALTDILWTASARVRRWRGGDVRAVYYTLMTLLAVWGIVALRLAQPIVLLKLGANVAAAIFVIASMHLLYINTRLLPPHVRPSLGRRMALVATALFYSVFVALALSSL
jgi:hypothetical protein